MNGAKKRHAALTVWLVLMIVFNLITAASTLLMSDDIRRAMPNFPVWAIWTIAALALWNVVCAVALFNWKKWGFYGFCASAVLALIINVYGGVPVFQAVLGLVGIVILYAVLQIGSENKGWTQLE